AVRPVPAARRRWPAVLRRPQRDPGRTPHALPPTRLPAVALAARGGAPGAVRLGPLAAPPPDGPGRRVPRLGPARLQARDGGASPRRRAGPVRRTPRAGPHLPVHDRAAARDPRARPGADVAARGPRELRDGRGGRREGPRRRPHAPRAPRPPEVLGD